jgi:long-chain acyl-CoA synthetase
MYILTMNSQGLTTAAQKLNRKGILQQYQKEVDQAYGRS